MTFSDLLDMVRREIIADQYADAYSDADIEDVLWKASVEIAAAFDIPRELGESSTTEGATVVALGVDAIRLHALQIAGDDGVSADIRQVWRMRAVSPGPLRYFNFDVRRSSALAQIAPTSTGGSANFEYTPLLERATPIGPSEPWNGTLSQFHTMVAYRAGISLYEMAEREDETQHWTQQYELRAAELAAWLGRTDMANLMIQPEARNDKGSRG